MNDTLKNICRDSGIFYFDIYDYIRDENHYIKKEYTKDGIHLDYDNNEIREYIENYLFDLIKKQ